jgi:hypothetical protein
MCTVTRMEAKQTKTYRMYEERELCGIVGHGR